LICRRAGGDGQSIGGGLYNAGLDSYYGELALVTYDWDAATETFVQI
jgi:hypothetical protein